MRLIAMAAWVALTIWAVMNQANANQPEPRPEYPAEVGLYPEDSHLEIPKDFTGTMVTAWGDYQNEYKIENGQIWAAERVE